MLFQGVRSYPQEEALALLNGKLDLVEKLCLCHTQVCMFGGELLQALLHCHLRVLIWSLARKPGMQLNALTDLFLKAADLQWPQNLVSSLLKRSEKL